jgi:nucleoside-diphosphate-sugar epimerase
MKVVITGGAGFLGQLLIRALCARGVLTDAAGGEREIEQIVAIDQGHTQRLFVDERVGYVVGDISVPALLKHVLATDTDVMFHLAAVVSGAAEADFDLGMRVNLDGTRALLDACRTQRAQVKLVFASSVAVFGGALPAVVTDETAATPVSSYGVQKLIGELLVGEFARKGFIDGRAVRLPTIVVRPGKPNAAASSFASSIIREPLAGEEAICPVEADTALWLLSPQAAIDALLHAHELPRARWDAVTHGRALNLPGLTVTVREMLEALRAVGGDAAVARVKVAPDPRIKAIVQSWPARFDAARAAALGFRADAGIDAVVRAYAQAHAAAPGSAA